MITPVTSVKLPYFTILSWGRKAFYARLGHMYRSVLLRCFFVKREKYFHSFFVS